MSGRAHLWLRVFVCLCVAVAAMGGTSADSNPRDEREQGSQDSLDAFVAELAAEGFSGSVLVVQRGDAILQKGYGCANDGSRTPISERTLFYLASVSKQFTAAAVMRLREKGKVRLEDTLGTWLAEVPADKTDITIHQLLTHTSGLVEYVGEVRDVVARDEALRTVLSSPLRFVPGAEYGYSNAGYMVLAAVLERVAGTSFQALMHREVFGPAGMTDTFLLGERAPEGNSVAHGYTDGADEGDFSEWKGPSWAHLGGGGVFSNVRDMARWDKALGDDRFLSEESRARMFTPFVKARQEHYGYGWRIGTTSYAGPLIYHYGSEAIGMGAAVMRFPERKTTIVVLSNRTKGDRDLAAPTAVAIAHKLLEGRATRHGW